MAFGEIEAEKRPPWRPTKYDPAFCERAVELGSEGRSKVEIAYELGVDRKTLDNWAAAHEDFFHAITRAKEAEQVWWERKGRDNLTTQGFQSSMWSRSMGARFPDDWREKSEVDMNAKVQVTEVKRTIVDPRNSDA
jgi:hypothetical protein